MDIRRKKEMIEEKILSKYAVKSKYSLGREKDEDKSDIMTCFEKDRDKIIHSKAFRRLMHKTQVFIAPEDDHFRTRMTHTLEVSQIARTIAGGLFLNEDLTEAIALGHDLGHTPFGHLGEDALNNMVYGGFEHNKQSVRIVTKIEDLNLSKEVLDGILNHRGRCKPSTLEGKVVQIADKIAYINHDIDDAIRAGILKEEDLPSDCINVLGKTHKNRVEFLVNNIIKNSQDKNDILIDKEVKKYMYLLRKFLFDNVYTVGFVKEERKNYAIMIESIYKYYFENFNLVPKMYKNAENKQLAVVDYIAGMTDRYAIKIYREKIKNKKEF